MAWKFIMLSVFPPTILKTSFSKFSSSVLSFLPFMMMVSCLSWNFL